MMRSIRRALTAGGIGLLALMVGCGVRPAAETAATQGPAASDGYPQTVSDSFGYSLTIPRRPARVVSTACSNTEILFAVGAGEQVVGVTELCTYPPEAKRREKVGGFAPSSISIERITGM